MLGASTNIRCLRDPTRGGLSSTLNEIAAQSGVSIQIEETAIPIHEQVRGACELLGLDPLYVANEGKLVAIVAPEAAESVLAAMRGNRVGSGGSDHRNGWRNGWQPTCRNRDDEIRIWIYSNRGSAGGRSVAAHLLKVDMHEMGIASSVLEAVHQELHRYPGQRATKVGVRDRTSSRAWMPNPCASALTCWSRILRSLRSRSRSKLRRATSWIWLIWSSTRFPRILVSHRR